MTQRPAPEPEQPVVFIVEDDTQLRDALVRLFRTVGVRALAFGTAAEFLAGTLPDVASCLLTDVRLPGQSGLDLQGELARRNIHVPIVFMTGHGDIPMSVEAMKAGAVDFLTKPFRDQELIDAVNEAISRDRVRRARDTSVADLQARYEGLSPREKEVLALVTAGLMNKQVASEVGLSEITVKIHRGNAMRKMGARTLADLVRMAEALHVTRPQR